MANANALCEPRISIALCNALMTEHDKHVLNPCQQLVFAHSNTCCSVPDVKRASQARFYFARKIPMC